MTVGIHEVSNVSRQSNVEEKKAKLFFNKGSSCSWRVCIALKLKAIEFDVVEVDGDFIKQAHYSEKNPLHKLPALEFNGKTLHQTKAIIEYLEEIKPEPPLLPRDPYDRWAVRSLVDMVSSDIQPLQNKAVQQKVSDGVLWARQWITKGFDGIEKMLGLYRGTYAFGESVTMADVFLYPQIVNAHSYEVDFSPFPNISAVELALSQHSAFQREYN